MPRANKETSLETRRYVKSALSAAAVDSARGGVKGETVKSVR